MARTTDGGGHPEARVRQAQGMVSVQLGCELDDALARMRERADETGETLDEIAADVVARLTRFHR
jgi:AmiR/NasT family two-component response regulator